MHILTKHFRLAINSLFVVTALSLHGCQTIDDSTELPYVERLVVSGWLFESGFSVVFVERTLRFDEQYSQQVAEVRDADVAIIHNSIKYQLIFLTTRRDYSTSVRIPVIVGDECELIVRWQEKEVRAKTRMPSIPTPDSIRVNTIIVNGAPSLSFSTTRLPSSKECYSSSWAVFAGQQSYVEYDNRLRRIEDVGGDGRLHFFTLNDYSTIQIDSVRFFVAAFDLPYYEFYISRGYTEFVGLPVSFFSAPFRSNVTGDGTGLFIAQNSSSRTLRLR